MAKQKSQKKEKEDTSHLRGVIALTRRATGYVTAEGFEQDIEIPHEGLNTALNGDVVEIALWPKEKDKRQRGEVVRVIERAKTRFVGTLEKRRGVCYLAPDDQKLYSDIILPAEDTQKAKDGHKALVELTTWNNPKKNPEGRLLEIIGPEGEHETEMRAIALSQGFDTDFPEAVQKEADGIGRRKGELLQAGIKDRRDMRGVPTFTIDPADAKDFDDALSVQKLDNGNIEVGIHIADVTHYVTPGSAIDKEAQERATSVYLVDRTIPMLPEVLSNDVCSLNPEEDRLTFSAVFELNENAEIQDKWFGETIIHSNKRFTYAQAQKVLNTGDGPFAEELTSVNKLAKKMRKRREDSGAIDFDQAEVKFKLDENGVPVGVELKERTDTNMLIEDFMLLANREVATHMYELCKDLPARNATFIYRIHDVPKPEKIEELGIFVRALGYEFESNDGLVSPKDLNRLFGQIEGTPEEDLIKTATIRSMAKAVYSTKNIGHFGLSFRYYTHFTSPIRRYPDMMVHRILKSHLDKSPLSADELKQYEYMAIKSSEREASAVEAERESIKLKQVEYMAGHVGEEFQATISGVTEFGIFVQENSTHAEGLVRMSAIGDDYFVLDRANYRIVGERTKKKYQLGDEVRVKLVGADVEEKQLDFKFTQ